MADSGYYFKSCTKLSYNIQNCVEHIFIKIPQQLRIIINLVPTVHSNIINHFPV